MAETTKRFYPKKITTSGIGLDVTKLQEFAKENAQKHPETVMRVYGRLSDTKPDQSLYGPYTKYFGEFEAVNVLDGTVHRSRTLIVPPVAETCLDSMLAAGRRTDPEASVIVALDIGVQYYRNPNKTGTEFRFSASPIGEPQKDEISEIGAKLPQLSTQAVAKKASK